MEQLLLFPMMGSQSTSSSEAAHAKMPALPEKGKASSKAQGVLSHSLMPDWLMNWQLSEAFGTLYGKTSLEFSPSTVVGTSPHFFRVFPGRKLHRPSETDGRISGLSETQPKETSDSAGVYWTSAIAEWTASPKRYRRDDGVSSLSDVLVTGNVPLKYYLSSKACSGIIHRSEVRGKVCPPLLAEALAAMIELMGRLEAWMATMPKADVKNLKDTPLEEVLAMYRDAMANPKEEETEDPRSPSSRE